MPPCDKDLGEYVVWGRRRAGFGAAAWCAAPTARRRAVVQTGKDGVVFAKVPAGRDGTEEHAMRYPFALRIDPVLKRRDNGAADTLWVTTDEGTYVGLSFASYQGEWQGLGLDLELYPDTTHLEVGWGEALPGRDVVHVRLPPSVRAALATGTVCIERSPILALDVRAGLVTGDPNAVTARAVPLSEAVKVDPLARSLAPACSGAS